MDDVEKKSLPNANDAETVNGCNGLQLHCFPDITDAESKSRRSLRTDEQRFQRVVPGSGGCFCAPCGTTTGIEGTGKDMRIEEAEQTGYQRGYREGEQKGRAEGAKIGLTEGRQTVKPVIDTLESLLDHLALVREQTYQRIESEIVDLAMAIARKIVGQELVTAPELVLKVIRQALGQVETAGRIRIKLNPEDLEMLNAIDGNLCANLSETAAVSFESEASISRGGCVVETEAGNIDARLETQFQVIDETFQAAMSKASKDGCSIDE